MDRKIDEIHKQVTDIRVLIERNTVTLEQNTKDIAHHIQRTDILEEKVQQALLPMVIAKWSAAVLVALASAASIVYTIFVLMGKAK